MKATGVIKTVVVDRGFGFIRTPGGMADLFFHVRDLDPSASWDETLVERHVEFEIVTGRDNRDRAAAVRLT